MITKRMPLPVAGGGSGASFAVDRGAAGTGADRERGGQSKNDCEQTAAKRLLARVRRAHPQVIGSSHGSGLANTAWQDLQLLDYN